LALLLWKDKLNRKYYISLTETIDYNHFETTYRKAGVENGLLLGTLQAPILSAKTNYSKIRKNVSRCGI
jgi:hypothetical protein